MRSWLQQLDAILRGEATRPEALERGKIEMSVGGLGVVVLVLGILGGLCVGSFALIRQIAGEEYLGNGFLQLVASAIKLPLLFGLTLLVTFPSLYVFNALVGSRLTAESILRLLVATLAVMLAVFASLGPIIVFFGLSTTSYPFMKLLNVVAGGVGGLLGLLFLLRTLDRLVSARQALPPRPEGREDEAVPEGESPPEEPASNPGPARPESPGALDRPDAGTNRQARLVFQIWVFVFALVGAQMSWVLRPFIGSPYMPFEWLRQRGQSNFFLNVIETIGKLFGSS